ncbi:polymorphic toxin-type HINT domain-containing protein [Streptomyces sp. NPDC057620]|uniref:polymorphic toxin-type HINT domain-containing protein n=1 Tax=Streptomyces sp. NPDC057620 TaxID=3346185 RepID=UPI00368908F6
MPGQTSSAVSGEHPVQAALAQDLLDGGVQGAHRVDDGLQGAEQEVFLSVPVTQVVGCDVPEVVGVGLLGVGIDDEATGLTHIGAREYDQSTGRFLSADPIIDVADPLQMNGYAYANNSPVSKSDPTGLKVACGAGFDTPCAKDDHNGDGVLDKTSYGSNTTNSSGSSSGTGTTWVASQTPKTNNIQDLLRYFSMSSPNGDSPDTNYWITPAHENSGDSNSCFGREGCRQALKYLLKHSDAAKAKRIAANYCVENFNKCVSDAKGFERTKLIEDFIGTLVAGGKAGSKAAKSVRAIGCKCFLAGTDVLMADGSTKNIEDIELGDEVLATDPESRESGPRKVTRLIVTNSDKQFSELFVATDDGIDKLTATHEHPFWSPSEDDWIEAGALTAGMTLLTDEKDTVLVTGNRSFTKHARTYNLTVADLHTYYVLAGHTPVLVHNSTCPITMDEAVSRAADFVGGEGRMIVSKSGGWQFMRQFRDAQGRRITQIARFDINPKSPHVQNEGPHLNLETQINGRTVRGGPLKDPHTPIDPSTARTGDIP